MIRGEFEVLFAPDAVLSALGLAVFLLFALSAMGAGSVAVLTAFSGRKKTKVFADKLAKQMAEFGVIVLGLCLILISIRWGLWTFADWEVSSIWRRFYHLFFDIPGHLAFVATLTSIIFTRVWKQKKKSSSVHYVLGSLSMLVWLATLMLFVLGWLETRADVPMQQMDLHALPALLLEPLPWLIFAQGLFLGLALAGGMGMVYLVIRRNREDYGRDYYAWAVRSCAGRALSSGIVQVFWGVALYFAATLPWADMALRDVGTWSDLAVQALSASPAFAPMLMFLGLCLLAWISLIPLIKSQTPLRLKGMMFVHLLFIAAGLTFLAMAYERMLGM
ncbi:hypothetical protein SAMN05660653_02114 [Desulfonatronum thiosulfatophilum]|uniref:Uncharacterized protein n=1 Tax=Desulfonatronum thiosulfatophilum TaxID=617002 RepID=A0A1G6DEI9_9BACT|nr:hypothetical protein [Desulfonatronum thiosulfatophilum]SDB43556.1 hypothetical protein SAMN05660653_02114 [Desulfonatronum thiosulfatophilum]